MFDDASATAPMMHANENIGQEMRANRAKLVIYETQIGNDTKARDKQIASLMDTMDTASCEYVAKSNGIGRLASEDVCPTTAKLATEHNKNWPVVAT